MGIPFPALALWVVGRSRKLQKTKLILKLIAIKRNLIIPCSLKSQSMWVTFWSGNYLEDSIIFLIGRSIFPQKRRQFKYIGSVWIEFIFTETENWNWKYCSKIIFKCVNSVVEPIFNEKVAKKWNLWVREQYIRALFTVDLVK